MFTEPNDKYLYNLYIKQYVREVGVAESCACNQFIVVILTCVC